VFKAVPVNACPFPARHVTYPRRRANALLVLSTSGDADRRGGALLVRSLIATNGSDSLGTRQVCSRTRIVLDRSSR
jgi:hypothetical protein